MKTSLLLCSVLLLLASSLGLADESSAPAAAGPFPRSSAFVGAGIFGLNANTVNSASPGGKSSDVLPAVGGGFLYDPPEKNWLVRYDLTIGLGSSQFQGTNPLSAALNGSGTIIAFDTEVIGGLRLWTPSESFQLQLIGGADTVSWYRSVAGSYSEIRSYPSLLVGLAAQSTFGSFRISLEVAPTLLLLQETGISGLGSGIENATLFASPSIGFRARLPLWYRLQDFGIGLTPWFGYGQAGSMSKTVSSSSGTVTLSQAATNVYSFGATFYVSFTI